MKKDKFKSIDIRFFLVPFFVLLLLFFVVTYIAVNNRIAEKYSSFEGEAISIAESYSHALVYSHDAQEIISSLLDDKLTIASKAILMIENKNDNSILSKIAQSFQLDEIHLYNNEGVIIYSKNNKYIGWQAYEGHPVHNFMISDKENLVEDIRKDSESDKYYKYAYIKNEDGSFVQLGVLAENIQSFLRQFEIKNLVDSLYDRENVKNVLFVNNEFKITASVLPNYEGKIIEDERIREQISKENLYTLKTILDNKTVFQVWVPVFHEGEIDGTLAVIWKTNELETEVKRIVFRSFIQFFLLIFIVGIILYYAYRKNKSNIKIAYYDKLTGLPNNEYLIEYLEDKIINSDNKNKAIFLLNCTNFKILNMTYGFNYGNKILVQIANKVKKSIEPKGKFFRFGADRFILVVDNYKTKEELIKLAKTIIDIFKDPFPGNIEHQYINVEISVVEVKQNDVTVDKLLQDATLAINHINRNAKEHICFYEDIMEGSAIRQDKIARALRTIIKDKDNDSLFLHFQPKWDIKKNRLMGFEALARLNIDGLGSISPVEFIDIAEKRLLIYDLGNQILYKACKFKKKLEDIGYNSIAVSINISGIQLLRDEFIKDMTRIIDSIGVDKKFIMLEITESILLDNYDLINQKLEEIKKLGILISLDDFGTGFSSLSRLSDLNIDFVKIDKQFIDRIADNNDEVLITADIISMSHKFSLSVVAEGVERDDQRRYLEKNDCDIIQGYLLSKPVPESEALEFIRYSNLYQD